MPELPTADELTKGIAAAIQAHDFEAVLAMLHVLAVVDPHAAQDVLDTIELGTRLASA